jgi:hypothetical protein
LPSSNLKVIGYSTNKENTLYIDWHSPCALVQAVQ